MHKHVAIIGNGVAGITAARFICKQSDCRITVVSGESDYFFSRTALMYIYMGHMTFEDTKPYEDWFWKKNRIDLVRGYVTSVDTERKRLILGGRKPVEYDALIIATGSSSNRFGWPGQDLPGVQGLYSVQDLEEMERWTDGIEAAVVVGGGLIGIEMAEMLHTRHIPVTFLVRESSYMNHLLPEEESVMVNREIREHHIDLRLSTELKAIHAGPDGSVANVETGEGKKIACDFVGLTVGVHPNIGFLGESEVETDRGVLVNEYFETSVPDVYAIGDCAQFRDPEVAHRPIEQLWYTARRHGRTVAGTVCGRRTRYDKGVFFNSAKFFTIEYQTYGDVPNRLPDQLQTVVWQHEDGKRLIRINYERESAAVVGFNLMGIRFRHATCEEWIRSRTSVDDVLKALPQANFDPEFFPRFEGNLSELTL
ncbi:MAG: NAD(P)/FAD-dependent oxidoreductase [Rhodothermia bacterium]|nr:NAD(P)/FAD-dependent oxidoreductase [Rhodothermia bacterium]